MVSTIATASSRVMWTFTKCASVQHTPGVGHARQSTARCSKFNLTWVWKAALPRCKRASADASDNLLISFASASRRRRLLGEIEFTEKATEALERVKTSRTEPGTRGCRQRP